MSRYLGWGVVSNLGGVPLAEDEKTSKASSLEHLKTLLPVLSLAAYIFTQLSEKHPTASRVLLGLSIFLVAVSYYSPLMRQLAPLLERRKDNAVAKAAFPRFSEFVHHFGEFIDSRLNNTLHSMVTTEILQRRPDANAAFKLPPMDPWHSWWMYFCQQLDRQPRTMVEVGAALMEFHSLVGSYTNHCVTPIFEALPPNLKAEIPAEVKSSLNSFQQRYERFLDEYSQFAKSLSESRPILTRLPYWFNTPKPLT